MTTTHQLAVRGAFWTLTGYGLSQILRLGSNLVLAWLLFPEAFGLMALVTVFLQGLQMTSDIGLGPSIIQNKQGTDPVFLRTAWTLQILRGLLLWLIAWLLAQPVADFFAANDPMAGMLADILPIIGLTALIDGFASTGIHLLNRQLAMARLVALDLLSSLISYAVIILWAWLSPEIWAIVAGGLTYSLVRTLLSHVWNPGVRDRLGWDGDAFRELFHFGRWVFLSTLVTFLARNLDRLMLGKFVAMTQLGIYSLAMTFAQVAIQVAVQLSAKVLFPLLSRLQDDPERLVNACLRARRPVLWLSGAFCSGFALIAPLFFDTLYDDRYAEAGTLAQWLSLYVWTHILLVSMDRIPLSLGQPRALFIANLATTLTLPLALPGYWYLGLPGFILGMTLANLVALGYLILTLPCGRALMTWQSTLFSLGFLLYTLPLILLLKDPHLFGSPLLRGGMIMLAASLPPLAGIGYTWKALRSRAG
ncbi:MAG: polysaccharide biosynthesis protein [Gammaproteobacteria bacterium]|jgi:O-antigen/teichoic acid export membrane protein|nr:oligosaccharide flippase family protein [Candidatus Thioaporhodococcus sediminis]TNF56262.1 MAG: polysaccharide biosynthesis protein [Gammaproteobacteria bacterium]